MYGLENHPGLVVQPESRLHEGQPDWTTAHVLDKARASAVATGRQYFAQHAA